MRRTIFIILLLIIGCKDRPTDLSNYPPIEQGEYDGVFTFTDNGFTTINNVKFIFTDTAYVCIPEKVYMPPAGGGKYELKPSKLILTDMVMHTAEFDWTLILNGEFKYSKSRGTIILAQDDKIRNRVRIIELTKSN